MATRSKNRKRKRRPDGRRKRRSGAARGEPSKLRYVYHPSFSLPGAEERLWGPDRARIRVPHYRLSLAVQDTSARAIRKRTALTPDQEKTLFLRYNYAMYRLAKLSTGDRKTSRNRKRKTLWRKRARAMREKIVHANLPLVPAMARRAVAVGVEFADLVSEGYMTILRCIEHFDAARGYKFSTYACRAILACFHRMGTRAQTYRKHVPARFEPEMQKSDYSQRRHEDQLATAVASVRDVVLRNRADLSDMERTVLLGRFPLASTERPLTLSQMGRQIGLSNERVRQIESAGLSKVREALEDMLVA